MSTKIKLPKFQKGSKKKAQLPETEDEYLAAGVKEEEAGEKWRAGDAAKSCRFFLRAIDIYHSGLERHPRSFDLAYNKARLQYDLSQQPRLLLHQPFSLIELLFIALESHKYALTLRVDHADVLFNTAQVMVSIAEALIDPNVNVETHDRTDATPLLYEAIGLFQRCLHIQEERLREAESIASNARQSSADSNSTPPSQSPAESESEEGWWASVEETITSATLLDTCLAEVHAWTTLIPLLGPGGPHYNETESSAMKALERAINLVNTDEERIAYQQATLNLKSILADYAYRRGLLSSAGYAAAVSEIWSSLDTIVAFGPALCDHADALVTLSNTLASDHNPDITSARWKALATALRSLAQANTNPGPADRVAINERRGDVELLRARLGDPPVSLEQASKSRDLLTKNAETYYEGARKLADANGDSANVNNMLAKILIVKGLREGNMGEVLNGLPANDQSRIQIAIGEMVEEGLIAL